jgi:Predicted membrane protein
MKKQPIFTVRALVVCAMLAAIYVAQTFIPGITPTFQIPLEFIPLAIAGYLFGPIPAMLVGFVGDVVGNILVNAKEFNIFFTLIYVIGGLIFGLVLHNRKQIKYIIIASVVYTVVVDFVLTTLALYLQYNEPFAKAVVRIAKGGVVAIIMPFIIFWLIKLVDRIYDRKVS